MAKLTSKLKMLNIKQAKIKLFTSLPVISLYFFSFYHFQIPEVGKIGIFSFNFQMILIYFYVLKFPEDLGFGNIFLAGIINDTVIGIPLGTTSLSYLLLSVVTSYVRNATIRPVLTSEWFAFIPALFFSNLVYLVIINNFSNISFYYLELIQNTFFTFLFFPIFHFIFSQYQKLIKNN
jgi:cell shape-determining protein MreD|tara:strand:- start:1931 stop:2464 length:534 start_codon:yes stop_codon:yes gene_type:complete